MVRLLTDDELIEASLGTPDTGLNGFFVEAKLLFYEKYSRALFLKQFKDSDEHAFPFFVEAKRAVPDNIIEELILEENSGANARKVILIGNERVVSNFSLGESVQIIVIDQGFLKDFGHLVDTVYEFAHLADRVGEIRKITDDVIYELLLYLR